MPVRIVAVCSALLAAAALGIALALEQWEGLAPCALCLVERWPYRIVIGLGLLALLVGGRAARILLWLAVLALAADTAIAFVHVGVEQGWWPSPLPECQAPAFSGGSIAERLARMPAQPAKPCDSPSYLWPAIPVSLAAANFLFALGFTCMLGWVLAMLPAGPRRRRRR
ncbi:MAG: disulfide bond formation protein B [Rhodospirillales bacterium]|nr:disulfide bond formation protein B [Rhodospirillales bacterium]